MNLKHFNNVKTPCFITLYFSWCGKHLNQTPDCLSSCENLTLAHALFDCKVYIAIKKTWLHWHATKRALITPVDWWLIQSQYWLMEWHSGFFPEQHNLFYFTLSFLVEPITTTQLISIPYPISRYPHFACVWLHFNLHTAGILFNQLAATVGRQRLSLGWAWRPLRFSRACSFWITVRRITGCNLHPCRLAAPLLPIDLTGRKETTGLHNSCDYSICTLAQLGGGHNNCWSAASACPDVNTWEVWTPPFSCSTADKIVLKCTNTKRYLLTCPHYCYSKHAVILKKKSTIFNCKKINTTRIWNWIV